MDRLVARANIKHYKELLEQTHAPEQKEQLLRLLAEEEAKLKIAEAKHRAQQEKDGGSPPFYSLATHRVFLGWLGMFEADPHSITHPSADAVHNLHRDFEIHKDVVG